MGQVSAYTNLHDSDVETRWVPYIDILGGEEVTVEKVARSIYFIGLLIISPSARRTSRLFEPNVK